MAKKRVKAGTSKASAAERRKVWVEGMIQRNGNQTQAAVYAGIAAGAAAEKYGYRMSKDVRAQGMLRDRLAQVHEAAQDATLLTEIEVRRDLAEALRFNPKRLYKPDGSFIPMHELPDEVSKHLEGTEYEELYVGSGEQRAAVGRVAKIKFPKKTAVREQAMKHFGLYELDNKQKPAVSVNVGVLTVKPDQDHFERVRARALKAA